MRSLLAIVALCAGCVNAPTVDPPDDDVGPQEPTLWPGYCVAESELDGLEGPDGRRVAEYDANDRLTSDSFDSDLDGDTDVLTTYEYDEQDRLVRLVIDRFADSIPDEVRTYEWDGARMTRETWDQNADGEIDVDITYEHDDQGRRMRGVGHSGDDEEPAIVFRFEYTGDLLTALYIDGFSRPADGTFDRVIFYAYDDAGNLTIAFFDFDGNGTTDMVVTYSYDCWM